MRRYNEEPTQFVFLGYNPQELEATPSYEPTFRPGEILAEVSDHERHLGADEIVVVRLSDDVVDSVWPEEVLPLA